MNWGWAKDFLAEYFENPEDLKHTNLNLNLCFVVLLIKTLTAVICKRPLKFNCWMLKRFFSCLNNLNRLFIRV